MIQLQTIFWARNITALPIAFPTFLKLSRDLPLHVEFSHSVPYSRVPSYPLQQLSSIDIWGELISTGAFNRVESLRLVDSPNLHSYTQCNPSAGESLRRISQLNWSALTRAEFVNVVPPSGLSAPLEVCLLLYEPEGWIPNPLSFTHLASIPLSCQRTLRRLEITLPSTGHLTGAELRSILPSSQDPSIRLVVQSFHLVRMSVANALELFRFFKLPENIQHLKLDLAGGTHDAPAFYDVLKLLDCVKGGCNAFVVETPISDAIRVIAWRAVLPGAQADCQPSGMNCPPTFDLTFRFESFPRGETAVLKALIETLSEGCHSPTVVFYETTCYGPYLEHRITWDSDSETLLSMGARILSPYHPVHSLIRRGKHPEEISALRKALRENEGRWDDSDEEKGRLLYTEREERLLRDILLSLLVSEMDVSGDIPLLFHAAVAVKKAGEGVAEVEVTAGL